ncbi:family 43 glycosylhydrolase [Lentzea tibetensis]|uniref:Family 43 glycosylhydrolase n=1 Tax=Lentzea tibetensis TaxID=2591470 RepID=A0A563ETH7_9PSEU|nr:family 43 glycosylhydrolase [Lentzea tibetensis]TWP50838.1 family 43 glycosylhydrolase [Lentzea tibetensis]
MSPIRLVVAMALVCGLTACDDEPVAIAPPVEKPSSTTSSAPPPAPEKLTLAVEKPRQSGGVVVEGGGNAPYNYAPTVLSEGGRIRAWWCSQMQAAVPPGDDVLMSEGPSASGPFGPASAVFAGSSTGFDGMHVCDPSVLRVGDTYYMYYTGAAGDHANGNAIGVATSPDGMNWTRANNGAPIVGPAYDAMRENTYGAGQPSVTHVDGWYYLMFTDTTGRATEHNGAGQFVLRSKSPLFTEGVEALGESGMAPVTATNTPRTRSIVQAFSADWMWVDAAHAFAIAHETDAGTTITFWDKDFTRTPYDPVLIPGVWREGPGLVRTAEGHAPIDPADPCGRVSLDVLRATTTGAAGAPTAISHFGLDAVGMAGCFDIHSATALDGLALPSPERTVDLVLGGKVIRFERRSVAEKFARGVIAVRPAFVDSLPVVARVPAGAQAVRGPDGQVGLVLDGKLWIVGAEEVAALNSSTITGIGKDEWNRYERRGDLTVRR